MSTKPAATPETKTILGLPADLESCHALIKELLSMVEQKDTDITALKQRLHNLLRDKYGKSSEKISPEQLLLFAEQLSSLLGPTQLSSPTDDDGSDAVVSAGENGARKHSGGGRARIPDHLNRKEKHYYPQPDEMQCSCGLEKTEFAKDVVEQLDFVPASIRVVQHIVHKYRCKKCRNGVVEGKRPEQIQSGGKPTEGLIAQISTAKYGDHQPLERQGQIYAREGVAVSPSSMGRWLSASANELSKITDRMLQLLLQCNVLVADESPFDLADNSRATAKIRKGYVWALYGDTAPYTYFEFAASRSGDTAKKLLGDFNGFLLTDGYGGYNWFPANRSANCNVHARRYFDKALKYDKKRAGAILALYRSVFQIERDLHGKSAEEILQIRQQKSLPLMNEIHALLLQWKPTVPPKTTLGTAINYTLERWDQLVLFTANPQLRPDTNQVENQIRVIALGRKNWLRISGDGGLKTASVHATLVNTCKRLGLNPYLYLRDVLIRLGEGLDDIDDLLPDRWKLKYSTQDQQDENAAISAETVAASAPL